MKKKFDPNRTGHFVNWQQNVGYHLEFTGIKNGFLGSQTPHYRIQLNQKHPLRFLFEDGSSIMPANCSPTDQGTIRPFFVRRWINKDRFLLGFLFHDSAYSTGGFWFRANKDTEWAWLDVTRFQADALLRTMCQCDIVPCGWWKANLIWTGVRFGAWFAWRGNEPRGENPNGWIEEKPMEGD